MLVGSCDDLLVAHRTARLDHGLDAGCRRGIDAVAEGEERVAGHGRTRDHKTRLIGLERSDLRADDAAHLSGPDADGVSATCVDDRVGLHVLGDAPREQQVVEFGRGRRALGHDLQFVARHLADVTGLHQQAGADAAHVHVVLAVAVRNLQHAHVGFFLRIRQRSVIEVRRDQHLDELAIEDRLRGGAIEPRVERDDAAERRRRISRIRVLVGVGAIGALRYAARVGVLDDHAGRTVELANAFPCRVAVGQVVEAEFLALQLLERRQRARHRPQVAVERGLLVRVFAVTQVHDLDEVAVALRREQRLRAIVRERGQVVADERVVLRDVVERGHGQREAGLRCQRAAVGLQLVDERRVLRRIGGDRDAREVLGGRTQHRRAADVDVFDDIVEGAGRIHRHAYERVEIQHQQVDRFDAVLRHHRIVGPAAPEQAAMHHRVQGLDPAVHHFREPGEVADVLDGQACIAQRLCSAAGRDQFDIEGGKRTAQVGQAGLVGHRQQRAADGQAVGSHARGHIRRGADCRGGADGRPRFVGCRHASWRR